MGEYLIKEEGICSLYTVTSESDLNSGPGVNLNPPPENGCCECCGRQISELKPFSCEGIFNGAYLVKSFREQVIIGEEELTMMCESQERVPGEPNLWIKAEFDFSGPLDVNWECAECFYLSDEEFYKQMFLRIEREEELALAGDEADDDEEACNSY